MSKPNHTLVPLDYARPPRRSAASKWRPIAVTAIALIAIPLFVSLAVRLPLVSRPSRSSNRVKCSSNMRQIGQAVAMYANEHGGLFPDDVETILENGDVTSGVFVCPSSNDEPAPEGPTTQATAAGLRQAGHLSYVYLGKGLNNQTVTDDMVLLYEPLSNHAGAGMNVMFGDFHVEWLTATEAATILKQVVAKTSRIRYPLMQSSTTRAAG